MLQTSVSLPGGLGSLALHTPENMCTTPGLSSSLVASFLGIAQLVSGWVADMLCWRSFALDDDSIPVASVLSTTRCMHVFVTKPRSCITSIVGVITSCFRLAHFSKFELADCLGLCADSSVVFEARRYLLRRAVHSIPCLSRSNTSIYSQRVCNLHTLTTAQDCA